MPRVSRIAGAWAVFVLGSTLMACGQSAPRSDAFKIQVLDEQTGRGVPLVELKTVTNQRYFTDSAGMAAICEPELFGQTAFFYVSSHGYEFPKDGFGVSGQADQN